MASFTISAYAYVRHLQETRDKSNILRCLTLLTQLGYRLVDDTEFRSVYHIWTNALSHEQGATLSDAVENELSVQTLFTPGISVNASKRIDEFTAQVFSEEYADMEKYDEPDPETMTLHALSTARANEQKGFQFTFEISPNLGLIHPSIDSYLVGKDVTPPLWMQITDVVYQAYHPICLFPFYNLGDEYDSRQDTLALNIHWLHPDYNYWGPEIVDHIGRERVLATPRARVVPLNDTGVFLQPANAIDAAHYFGLERTKY